jgi:hypothetical protein
MIGQPVVPDETEKALAVKGSTEVFGILRVMLAGFQITRGDE